MHSISLVPVLNGVNLGATGIRFMGQIPFIDPHVTLSANRDREADRANF